MTEFSELPAEVIEQVLDHVGNDEATLLAVAGLGSPLWRDSSRPRLFPSVDFGGTRSLVRFAKLCQSPHCSFPKRFQRIVLRAQAGVIDNISDLILVLHTLAALEVIDSVKIDVAANAQPIPPWIIEATSRFWTDISHLEIVGGTHSAPQLFNYVAAFSKLKSLSLDGVLFTAMTERLMFPRNIKKVQLARVSKFGRFLHDRVIQDGGFSAVENLEVWAEVSGTISARDVGPDELTRAFRAGHLSHLKGITIHQEPLNATGLQAAMTNMTSLRLSKVGQLKHLSLDYSGLNTTTLVCVLFGHLQGTTSASMLETLEIRVPAYTSGDEDLLVDCLQDIDSELEGANESRLDDPSIRPFDIVIRDVAGLEDVNHQDPMPHAIGRGHRVIFTRD